ncbi:MAG TPA: alpha-1,4-glucan--maltose-1-phosphate maltosyltransferase [Euzebyales bacterium]
MKNRVVISSITPTVDAGRHAVKAVVGDDVIVGADILREGHELLAACIRFRGPHDTRWREAPMREDVNDRWFGSFPVDAMGPWRYTVMAWTDHYRSWLRGARRKVEAETSDVELTFADGANLLERRLERLPRALREVLTEAIEVMRGDAGPAAKLVAAADEDLLALLDRHPERMDRTISRPELPLWVDRERGRFSAWYELFPRSYGATETTSGTFADAAKRLPAIAEMGFDVVYLPPIHPIGTTNRKGPGGPHDLDPGPDAPGVPWAIGSADGGHMSVHPDLGTIEDFDAFVAETRANGMEVALDFAIQCSPDHPWVTEHPEWFRRRADGSIAYAENPPKKYQDIYPIDFDTPDIEGLTAELKRVVEFWIGHDVKMFRVDNPHTKALPFWEWLISDIHAEHPDVLFLAEAFTRPKMMQTLAKLGFSQSYTYFTWRNYKHELIDYVTELAHGEMANYYRPNFWPNTPDILHEYLQHGGRPAFKVRLVLAALLSPSWGMYSGYELVENTPLHEGSEEYLHSEKYSYRPRDWDQPYSLAPYITRINTIRRSYAAFRRLRNVWFHHIDNDDMLCFSKVGADRSDAVLTIVNLNPFEPRESTTWLDMWQLGLEHAGPYEAYDLVTETSHIWHGPANYVRLDPSHEPAHVFALRAL